MKLRSYLAAMGIIAAILTLDSCASTSIQTDNKTFLKQDAISEIYSIVNKGYCKIEGVGISSSTVDGLEFYFGGGWQQVKQDFPELEKETWENFTEANPQQIPLLNDLKYGSECPSTPRANSCSETYAIYFSPIGFNSENNQALVARAETCGDFGIVYLFFVKLVDDHWEKINSIEGTLIGP